VQEDRAVRFGMPANVWLQWFSDQRDWEWKRDVIHVFRLHFLCSSRSSKMHLAGACDGVGTVVNPLLHINVLDTSMFYVVSQNRHSVLRVMRASSDLQGS